MTAEEFLKEHGIPNMPTQYSLQFQTDVNDTVKALEAYANQKVLEALGEVKGALNDANNKGQKNGDIYTAIGCIHLIETEVEPKYK